MRLLIVEDDQTLSSRLEERFVGEGFSVDTAFDGDTAASYVSTNIFALIILDLGLPNMDGLALLKKWRDPRQHFTTPILVLTARSSWTDKVTGLNLGADDYVTKPFEIEELMARVRALVRRSAGESQNRLTAGLLSFDTASRQAMLGNKVVDLTAKEASLLHILILNKGKVQARDYLHEQLYDSDSEIESNTLDVFIRRIRRKIGAERIITVRGYGYRLVSE